jgi:hypothetical protein
MRIHCTLARAHRLSLSLSHALVYVLTWQQPHFASRAMSAPSQDDAHTAAATSDPGDEETYQEDGYIIRRMTRADLDMARGWAVQEHWNPGVHDLDAFWAADPRGFFIGV